jgi:thiol:disulfide interchange protein
MKVRQLAPLILPALLCGAASTALAQEGAGAGAEETSLATMLLFALLGGLILNIMPCVLPVLSIKVLGLVNQAEDDAKRIWLHGVAYTVGILVSFAVLGGLIIEAQASGKMVGWGFQFQNSGFVATLIAIVFAFGLNLFGLFEVSFPGAGSLDEVAAKQHGLSGSFLNGVFATVLATPCTAPFLAPALGFALSQPAAILMLMLLVVGFGLALPFLVLAAFPKWAGFLPKPGAWMTTFKKSMGFLLIGTALWLIDVLSFQVTREGLISFLAFLLMVALGGWIYGHWGSPMRSPRSRWTALIVALLLIGGSSQAMINLERPAPTVRPAPVATAPPVKAGDDASNPTTDPAQPVAPAIAPPVVDGEIQWLDFAANDVNALAKEGKTVFIDFTASWCVTCKVFERTVINTDDMKAKLTEGCIVPVKADYTNEDPNITTWLKRFKRPGVPMYLILPAGKPEEVIQLPDALTASSMLEGLKKAGPSKAGSCGKANGA